MTAVDAAVALLQAAAQRDAGTFSEKMADWSLAAAVTSGCGAWPVATSRRLSGLDG